MARDVWLYSLSALFVLRNMPSKVDLLDLFLCAAIVWLLLQDAS